MPSYCGYTAYDDVYIIADAIHRAGSTDSDKLVAALERTDYVGTIGRGRVSAARATPTSMASGPARASSPG